MRLLLFFTYISTAPIYGYGGKGEFVSIICMRKKEKIRITDLSPSLNFRLVNSTISTCFPPFQTLAKKKLPNRVFLILVLNKMNSLAATELFSGGADNTS